MCGIGKRSHHTGILRALNLDNISTGVLNQTTSLFKRICSIDSPTQQLCFYMLSDYILNNNLVPGSTVARLVNLGLSPVKVIFNKINSQHDLCINDGIVDSLRSMIFLRKLYKNLVQ